MSFIGRYGYEFSCRVHIVLPAVVVLLALPFSAKSQWVEPDSLISISQLKKEFAYTSQADSLGQQVAIAGIATVASGLLHETYLQTFIQEDSAAVPIFGYSIDEPISEGDSVVVKGEKQRYFGQPELLVNEYRVYPKDQPPPEPVDIFKALRNPGRYVGMLVAGKGIIRERGNRFNGKYLLIAETDTSEETIIVYVSNFHARYQDFDFNAPRIGEAVTVKGVVSQYDPAFPESKTYKVFLRTPEDFSYTGWPRHYFKIIAIVLLGLIIIAALWTVSLRREVKRKTEALQQSLNEKEMLLKEIHHRTKNNLAIISGLLEMQAEAAGSNEVKQALKESQTRLTSMALVHERLYQTSSLNRISMKTYLEQIADAIHEAFAPSDITIDIRKEVDDIKLNSDQVVPLGLLINELLVNAFKHAFKNKENGIIWLELVEIGNMIKLKVEDNGVGLPEDVDPDESNSLGMLLIDAFAEQLGARKTIENTPGACFTFEFPS